MGFVSHIPSETEARNIQVTWLIQQVDETMLKRIHTELDLGHDTKGVHIEYL